MTPYTLGFRQEVDERDFRFPLSSLLTESQKKTPVMKNWKPGPVRDQGNVGACFPPKTLIRMSDGSSKRIDDVRLMDSVLTAEGRIGMVTQLMVRQNADTLIKLKLWGHSHLRATPEHPILTKRGYVQIKDVSLDDFVAMPRFQPTSSESVETSQFLNGKRFKIGKTAYGGVVGRSSAIIVLNKIPDCIHLNKNTGRIFVSTKNDVNISTMFFCISFYVIVESFVYWCIVLCPSNNFNTLAFIGLSLFGFFILFFMLCFIF